MSHISEILLDMTGRNAAHMEFEAIDWRSLVDAANIERKQRKRKSDGELAVVASVRKTDTIRLKINDLIFESERPGSTSLVAIKKITSLK